MLMAMALGACPCSGYARYGADAFFDEAWRVLRIERHGVDIGCGDYSFSEMTTASPRASGWRC